MSRMLVGIGLAGLLFTAAQPAQIPAPPELLRLVATIPLEGQSGKIGPMEADTHHSRLFVALSDENAVKIIDVRQNAIAGSIGGLSEPREIAYADRENRLFVANEGDGTLRIIDGEKLKQINSIRLGIDAGAVHYDAPRNRLCATFGENGLATFDANGKKLAQVDLKGRAVSFAVADESGQIYASLPEMNSVAVVNSEGNGLAATWPVKYAADNRALAIDEEHKRVFIACRRPPRILVVDLQSGTVTARIPTVVDPSSIFHDPIHSRLYVSGGAGRVAVYAQRSADQYEEVGYVATTPGARYSLFVPEWNLFFLGEPAFGKHPAAIKIYKPRD